MKKQYRLRRLEDFRTVYRHGCVVYGKYLVFHSLPVSDQQTKIGYSVSKKVSNAVVRNSAKWKLRTIIQEMIEVFPQKHYLVIGAKIKSKDATYQQLKEDFSGALKVLGKER